MGKVLRERGMYKMPWEHDRITAKGGQLTDQNLNYTESQRMSGHCPESRWTKRWWARNPCRGTINTCKAVICVKMDSSEKGKVLCV